MRKPKRRESKPLAQGHTEERDGAERRTWYSPRVGGEREGADHRGKSVRVLRVSEPQESVRLGLDVAERRCIKQSGCLQMRALAAPH